MFIQFLLKYKLIILGVLLGALGGYAYYYYMGCTGTCTITSKPTNSTLYGALMGGLVFSLFIKEKRINKNQ